MTRSIALAPLLIAATLALTGCGLHPLYAGGSNGPVAGTLASVSVAPIEGEAGYLVRTALDDRLSASNRGNAAGDAARYRVEVRLNDTISGFGVRADDAVTRERRTLRARWQLIDTTDGTTLIDASATSDEGIDSVGSEYATIAAERTALERLSGLIADQIMTRIALYARREHGGSTPPGG